MAQVELAAIAACIWEKNALIFSSSCSFAGCELAVTGNTLFVTLQVNHTVGKYDANTGFAINASLIMGLDGPVGLALLGNRLFVVNLISGTVGEYDATSGAAISANFITGLTVPIGLAVKSAK